MSRSYVVLVAALVGVAGLAGVVALTQDDAGFVASADVDPPADDATTAAPSSATWGVHLRCWGGWYPQH